MADGDAICVGACVGDILESRAVACSTYASRVEDIDSTRPIVRPPQLHEWLQRLDNLTTAPLEEKTTEPV